MSTASAMSTLAVTAPLPGRVVALSDVPDPVFAKGLVGGGVAILPDENAETLTAVAPLDGKVIKVLPHAFIIQHTAGPAILVHIGIDTVKLKGAGFTVLASKGDMVKAGDPMVTVDATHARAAGLSLCSPVVVLDSKPDLVAAPTSVDSVETGGQLFVLPGQ
ncbi:PTS glucose transporter subunit IIA [Pseudarthrobacter sp. PS3-L1]|uniref:PTS sugar transporter subunit IIA n=1 Tax=Pseudarthrobacter sp. PS3-L1 TaxID=3046207 RepID=UPI0024BB2F62|nr:PTS glucose transporter subunit IIA [Pseudarthrobacter sp. PS3-L1]MDJ0319096.1 PTS glucose transporter subunit IIA [Pseudarthrobacter sp. PS3-L1]